MNELFDASIDEVCGEVSEEPIDLSNDSENEATEQTSTRKDKLIAFA